MKSKNLFWYYYFSIIFAYLIFCILMVSFFGCGHDPESPAENVSCQDCYLVVVPSGYGTNITYADLNEFGAVIIKTEYALDCDDIQYDPNLQIPCITSDSYARLSIIKNGQVCAQKWCEGEEVTCEY